MSRIVPKQVLDEIRMRNDIVDVVGAYVQLKRAGSTFRALCPFHQEKTPSFHVNPQRQIFHCFGCGAGGDVFKFIMQHESVDFMTAVKLLAQRVGVPIEFSEGERGGVDKDQLFKIHEEVVLLYHRALLQQPDAEAARAYLAKRELDMETVKAFRIGYAPDRRDALQAWGRKKGYTPEQLETLGLVVKVEEEGEGARYYDRFRGRLLFPICDELGRTVGFSGRIMSDSEKLAKYVNSPETPLFRKSRILFAMDKARKAIVDAHAAILCEGQIDCIRCHAAGFQNVVASQGTALTEEHVHILKRYADTLTLVLDADSAGRKAALRAANLFLGGGMSVGIAALPKGEDPDSLIRRQGSAAFKTVLDSARSVVDFQIDFLSEIEDLSREQGVMRVAREVLEMIRVAPTAIQREQLIRQAAHRLNVPEHSLRDDLRRLSARHQRASTQTTDVRPAIPEHPHEEVTLIELLVEHPDTVPEARHFLPLEMIADNDCRVLIEQIYRHAGETDWSLQANLQEVSEECRRLAAAVQIPQRKIMGEDNSPLKAIRDVILVLRRKNMERRRADLRRRMEQASAEEKAHLEFECIHLTKDLHDIQQGWEKARHILEMD